MNLLKCPKEQTNPNLHKLFLRTAKEQSYVDQAYAWIVETYIHGNSTQISSLCGWFVALPKTLTLSSWKVLITE